MLEHQKLLNALTGLNKVEWSEDLDDGYEITYTFTDEQEIYLEYSNLTTIKRVFQPDRLEINSQYNNDSERHEMKIQLLYKKKWERSF